MTTPAESGLEQNLGTVDVWHLRGGLRWPIMRAVARRFVEEAELRRFMRGLLETRRWSLVRAVPHAEATHVYDVYGVPSDTPGDRPASLTG